MIKKSFVMKKIVKLIKFLKLALENYFSNADVFYITEDVDWVVKKEGESFSKAFALKNVKVKVCTTAWGVRNRIVHFGSVNTFVRSNGKLRLPHLSNKVFLSWYHSDEADPRLQIAKKISESVTAIHTSCQATLNVLIKNGAINEKIFVAPIPIDLEIFKPDVNKRQSVRAQFGIKDDAFVIGSFQKDGNGWGEGETPKLIKGPDIFCDVIDKIKDQVNNKLNYSGLHILLSGPSRGYVKNRLEKMGVKYSHVFLKNPDDISDLYNALDCYLISSRVEGGPKSLMESWAMGVPLVTTRMGMPADLAINGKNALIARPDDVETLACHLLKIINDKGLALSLTKEGKSEVLKLTYTQVVELYYEQYFKTR